MHSIKKSQCFFKAVMLGKARHHRVPRALVTVGHFLKETECFIEKAQFRECTYHRIPCESVSVGHSVEQLAGVIKAAAFSIGIDQPVLDEDFRSQLGLKNASVDLAAPLERL